MSAPASASSSGPVREWTHPPPAELFGPEGHPREDCWELPYVWAALQRFVPKIKTVPGLTSVMDLEEALVIPPPAPQPLLIGVLQALLKVLRPTVKTFTDPEDINRMIHNILATIRVWPDPEGDEESSNPMDGGKSFWELGWKGKVVILRHLVDCALTTDSVKSFIEKEYHVTQQEKYKKRKDDPETNSILLQPAGEDSKRRRIWLIDDRPRIYASGNPWKKTTTMTALTSTLDDVRQFAANLRASADDIERRAEGQTKKVISQAQKDAKKERDLADKLDGAGDPESGFLGKCEKEEARLVKARKKAVQTAQLMAQAELRSTRTRRQTHRPDYVYDDPEDGDDTGDDYIGETATYTDEDEAGPSNGRGAILGERRSARVSARNVSPAISGGGRSTRSSLRNRTDIDDGTASASTRGTSPLNGEDEEGYAGGMDVDGNVADGSAPVNGAGSTDAGAGAVGDAGAFTPDAGGRQQQMELAS